MRIFENGPALILAGLLAIVGSPVAGAQHSGAGPQASAPATARPAGEVRFRTPLEAFEHGVGAYRGGHIELAVAALEYAAKEGLVVAEYALAQIFSDNAGPYTDHARAYRIYQRLADEHADIDPRLDRRAKVIARAFVALAGYRRSDLKEAGLKADPVQAAVYLDHAATYFGDSEAQFELAKMYLAGEGVAPDVARGKHWLGVLQKKGHPGAQAFLADLMWRGKYVQQNQPAALELIVRALEKAPAQERPWIEDTYHQIYCNSSPGLRARARSQVLNWQGSLAPVGAVDRFRSPIPAEPTARTCRDGEELPGSGGPAERTRDLGQSLNQEAEAAVPADGSAGRGPATPPKGSYVGTMGGFAVRDTGQSSLAPAAAPPQGRR